MIKLLIFLFSIVFLSIGSVRGDYINTLSGSVLYKQYLNTTFTGSNINVYSLSFDTSKSLYLDRANCIFTSTGSYDINKQLQIYFNSSSGSLSTTTSTFMFRKQLLSNTSLFDFDFDIKQTYSTGFYINSRIASNTINTPLNSFSCVYYGTLFDNINNSETMTGQIIINNVNESLNIFQSPESMLDFYIFEMIVILLIIIVFVLLRIIRI